MCYKEHHNQSLSFQKVPAAAASSCRPASFKGYSTPWVAYQPPKPTPIQTIPCSNCRKLRNLLLFIAAVAIFSPILISITSPLHAATAQPPIELTTHFLVYSAACFPVAGMAASFNILRHQTYRNMCAFCCLHAAATAIALRGLSFLHSATLPSSKTAGAVEFWAHCAHSVLLRPALWITGGDLDDFPFSEDARVQIWMLCMLCSAVLGLVVGFGLGRATSSPCCAPPPVKKPNVIINPLDAFLLNYEGKLHRINFRKPETAIPAVAPVSARLNYPAKKNERRSLSTIEAGFISACSLSGFWLCLTVIGTFATAVSS